MSDTDVDDVQVNAFAHEGLLLRTLPFLLLGILIPFGLLLIPNPDRDWFLAGIAGIVAVAIVAGVWFLPWDRLPSTVHALPPLTFLLVVALLRHAYGGHESGFAALFLISVLWLALYSTRTMLAVGLVGTIAAMAVPLVVYGAPLYPFGEWRRVVVTVAVAALIGIAVQRLIEQRRAADQRLRGLRALEIHDNVVQGLVVAKMALEAKEDAMAYAAIEDALVAGKRIVSELAVHGGVYRRVDGTSPGTRDHDGDPSRS